MEQFYESGEITLCKMIYRSFASARLLGGKSEGILRSHKKICQVVLPEVPVEPVFGGQVQQALDLGVQPVGQPLPVKVPQFLHKLFMGAVLTA